MLFKAITHGGPFDGLRFELPDEKFELMLKDTSSGRPLIHRYVLTFVDDEGERHYYHSTPGQTDRQRQLAWAHSILSVAIQILEKQGISHPTLLPTSDIEDHHRKLAARVIHFLLNPAEYGDPELASNERIDGLLSSIGEVVSIDQNNAVAQDLQLLLTRGTELERIRNAVRAWLKKPR